MERIRTTDDFICPRCGIHTALCFFTTGETKAHCLNCGEYYDVEIAPITNADRIRAMSDEELAKWMVGEQINGIYAFLKGLEDDDLLNDFVEEINLHGAEEIKKEKLEWLKQGVET